jgi:hypothetical protein
MLINLAQNSRKFMTNLRTISFSRKALFNGITRDGASILLVKIWFRILYCVTKIATLRQPIFYSDVTISTNNMRLTTRLPKTWAAGSSETSVQLYRILRPQNSSESNLNAQISLKFKYSIFSVLRVGWETKLQKHATNHTFIIFYCLTDRKRNESEAKQ